MAGTDESWDEGPATAIAGASYTQRIAESEAEPDFEGENGTAVAGQDYVENIRKSGELDPAARNAALKASADAALEAPKGQRSPTMAFGTPVLLRAPAQTPAAALPTTHPATARTPGGGLPGVPREPTPRPDVQDRSAPVRAKTPAAGTGKTPAPEVVRDIVRGHTPPPEFTKTPPPELRAKTPVPHRADTTDDSEKPTADLIPAEIRSRPSQQMRKPAPSPYVDQVYDSANAPTRESPRPVSKVMPIESVEDRSSPRAVSKIESVQERSGPLARQPRISQRFDTESATVEPPPPMRRHTPLPMPLAAMAALERIDDADDSAGDVDAFDNAETMGNMRRSVPMSVPSAPGRPTPAPLMPRASTPMLPPPVDPLAQTVQAMPSPVQHAIPAGRPSHNLSAQAAAALPTSYPVMSSDARASYLSPLSATPMQGIPSQEAAPVEKPRKRGLLIAGIAIVVAAAGIAGFLWMSGGDKPASVAATTPADVTKPEAKTAEAKPEATAAITAKDEPDTEEVAAKPEPAPPPDADKPTIATTTTPETTKAETKPAAKPATKPATKPVKRVAATKKAVRKVVKKPVRKPVRRPATKTAAKKCTGLDCL